MAKMIYDEKLYQDAVSLLQNLIRTPSFSKEETQTAQLLADFLQQRGVEVHRKGNNVWAYNKYYDAAKPTILLNSHHDTVKPNPAYTRDPFSPDIEGDKLYGLGSNDAGASGVSLLATFLHYYDRPDLKYNLCVAITAEEENSGEHHPRFGAAGVRHCRRTNPDAAGHCRTRFDGHRLHSPRQSRTRRPGRGRQCHLQSYAGYRVVPNLSFSQGVRSVWGGKDDRHHHLGWLNTTLYRQSATLR